MIVGSVMQFGYAYVNPQGVLPRKGIEASRTGATKLLIVAGGV